MFYLQKPVPLLPQLFLEVIISYALFIVTATTVVSRGHHIVCSIYSNCYHSCLAWSSDRMLYLQQPYPCYHGCLARSYILYSIYSNCTHITTVWWSHQIKYDHRYPNDSGKIWFKLIPCFPEEKIFNKNQCEMTDVGKHDSRRQAMIFSRIYCMGRYY